MCRVSELSFCVCFASGLEEENNNLYEKVMIIIMICAIEMMMGIIETTTCVDLKIHTFACRERGRRETKR